MGGTRFEKLHRPSLVALADDIARLTQSEAKKTGSPILWMTKRQIGRKIGADAGMVSLALRLAYTSEFYDEYGYGFVPPGNGRSCEVYGYALLHSSVRTTNEVLITLQEGNEKRTDHLNGAAMHFRYPAQKLGRNTKIGKRCDWLARQLDGAVATAEQVQEESEKLLNDI